MFRQLIPFSIPLPLTILVDVIGVVAAILPSSY